MFIDQAQIRIKAGDGGSGIVNFHREKYVNAGGPDGGDGGRGGDVIFVADTNLSTLVDFTYKRRYIAQNGMNGASKRSSGKSAEPMVIRVPQGTLIKDAASGRILADMTDDEPVVLAKGGKGGWGNSHFATPTRQIPRFAKPGLPGEQLDITLELKLIADVGLVGFPNVGKSTLISVVSAARPKIANYPFTTLSPVLGVVSVGEEKSFVMADIPGLIKGASDGVGLGHEFLRHVDRCRLIVHMIDVSGLEGRNPMEDFAAIQYELKNFSEELSRRPQIVAANKCELASPQQIAELRAYIQEQGYPFYEIFAAAAQGIQPLVYAISQLLDTLPPVKRYEREEIPLAELEKQAKTTFTITMEEDIFVVNADWLGHVLGSVDMDDYESLQYFQRVLRSSGIIAKLEEMGVKDGDTVSILDFEFDYLK